MITFEKQKTGYELVNKIIEKSIENSTFKQELLNNPHAAIESVYGSSISKKMDIIVEEQSNPAYVYLNIPPKPNMNEMELTDEQLEIVSGGELVAVGVGAAIVGAGLLGAAVGYGICKLLD